MYSSNTLHKVAEEISDKYAAVILDSDYKTELFHTHIDIATQSLKRASQLIGEVDNKPDTIDSFLNAFVFVLFIVTILFLM